MNAAAHIYACLVLFVVTSSTATQESITIHITGPAKIIICSQGTTEEEHDCQLGIAGTEHDNGCPDGFFMSNGSSQCFKIFNDEMRTWDEAMDKCVNEGLHLAEPSDSVAVALREDLRGHSQMWLGARGDGTKYVWQRSGMTLKNDSQLWTPSNPAFVTTGFCLLLSLWEGGWNRHPKRPYEDINCSPNRFFTLCEATSADQCTDSDGFCIETGDHCNGTIKNLQTTCIDHCACCVPEKQAVPQECPEGFLNPKGSKQCYKVFSDKTVTWYEAVDMCASEGLHLAEPSDSDAVALRKDLRGRQEMWLGASSDGYQYMWERSRVPLRSDSQFWYGSNPDTVDIGYCLLLTVWEEGVRRSPERPYADITCTQKFHTICEV